MGSAYPAHKLLIESKHSKIYEQLIQQASLPGLSIASPENPESYTADLVFGEPSLIRLVLDRLPNVQWIQSTWAGVEPLLDAKLRHNYILTNVRNVYGPLMSEYVLGYILLIERKILSRWQSQKERKWDASPNGLLRNKTIGLLGVGTTGGHIALTAKHFGLRVYGYTRQSETYREVDKYFHGGEWKRFVNDLDYLVCTMPGTRETNNFINAELIGSLPEKAWLINIGRGSTIDDSALIQALNNHKIQGAILDVFQDEPLPGDHPFWSTPNTFITFHTAAQNYPPDIAAVFIENYQRLIDGKAVNYQVNFELGY
jgi:phosphoglycerate dehydrogenase-like enzyme